VTEYDFLNFQIYSRLFLTQKTPDLKGRGFRKYGIV
jgi:hypothetical protein